MECELKCRCIFCLNEGDIFHTIEHIVPESLGNTDDILRNSVCDKCQNYFGKEIENYILSKTPFGFWRTLMGTPNKKGKTPQFNPSQNSESRGIISDFHPLTDSGITIHPAESESIVEVSIEDEKMLNDIITGKKNQFRVVMTPKMIIYIGRFLGKIALEYWCKEFGDDVFRKDFNELRDYVRKGTTKHIWPILHSELVENLATYRPINTHEEQAILYAYRFYQIEKVILFNLDIGSERYGIIVNEKYPPGDIFTDQLLSALCDGTCGVPEILYYGL